jgi:hypothetical protein
MEYCLTCEKVREVFVRELVKGGGEEDELIGLKWEDGVKRKSQRGTCVGIEGVNIDCAEVVGLSCYKYLDMKI